MAAIGRADLGNDAALANNAGRVQRIEEIDNAIGTWTAALPCEAVLEQLARAQVPSGKIYSVQDIARDEHYIARGMIQHVQMSDGSSLAVPGIIPKLSRTPGGHRSNAPSLGQDTDAVLLGLGITPEQISAMKEKGIVA
jgi:formyl-CoA transferase